MTECRLITKTLLIFDDGKNKLLRRYDGLISFNVGDKIQIFQKRENKKTPKSGFYAITPDTYSILNIGTFGNSKKDLLQKIYAARIIS